MLLLTSTSDLIRVVTDAAGDIEVHASYLDLNAGAVTPARTNTASITTATTTTVVGSPAASTQRNVTMLNIRNNHASQAVLTTVFHTDGTTQEDLFECTLLFSEALVLNQSGVWIHYDANGGMYPQVGAVASQAEMEAGTSTVTTVTPGRQHFHPSAAKAWGKAVGAGTSLTVSYNITSVADTGVGRLGVTIATDFSSANYAILSDFERGVTTLEVADVEQTGIRNASPAVGSFEIESYDHTATTLAADDPTNYFWACFGDL